jgi:hypothetical protein
MQVAGWIAGRVAHQPVRGGPGFDLASQFGYPLGDPLLIRVRGAIGRHRRRAGRQCLGVSGALSRSQFAQRPEHSGGVAGFGESDEVHAVSSVVESRTIRTASTCRHGPRPPRYLAHH